MNPITDPAFYAFAIPAVAIMGIGKGGFGGALAMVAMPLMALSGPPALEAGAIMFPILLLMDAISIWAWRTTWSRRNVALMLPGAVIGTALGYLTASWISDAALRLMLGLISLIFCAYTLAMSGRDLPRESRRWAGRRCGAALPASRASSAMSAARQPRSTCCPSGSPKKSSPARWSSISPS